ncbi:hypothetical protein ACFW9D_24850 [Streptomyces sp. NPDC059524]|uniref:hypothetical protein n=1 Tax=Streptomyces sp. NPDC059524 TaxID=3346856 RepID=UPI0036B3E1B3
MADEENAASGSVRRSWWDPVKSTVGLELAALAACGVMGLVGWPFGWLPDTDVAVVVTFVFTVEPPAELYRAAGPPRRLAAVAALLALVTAWLLVTAVLNWAFPALVDPGVGALVSYLVAVPVGVAVLAWFLIGANPG